MMNAAPSKTSVQSGSQNAAPAAQAFSESLLAASAASATTTEMGRGQTNKTEEQLPAAGESRMQWPIASDRNSAHSANATQETDENSPAISRQPTASAGADSKQPAGTIAGFSASLTLATRKPTQKSMAAGALGSAVRAGQRLATSSKGNGPQARSKATDSVPATVAASATVANESAPARPPLAWSGGVNDEAKRNPIAAAELTRTSTAGALSAHEVSSVSIANAIAVPHSGSIVGTSARVYAGISRMGQAAKSAATQIVESSAVQAPVDRIKADEGPSLMAMSPADAHENRELPRSGAEGISVDAVFHPVAVEPGNAAQAGKMNGPGNAGNSGGAIPARVAAQPGAASESGVGAELGTETTADETISKRAAAIPDLAIHPDPVLDTREAATPAVAMPASNVATALVPHASQPPAVSATKGHANVTSVQALTSPSDANSGSAGMRSVAAGTTLDAAAVPVASAASEPVVIGGVYGKDETLEHLNAALGRVAEEPSDAAVKGDAALSDAPGEIIDASPVRVAVRQSTFGDASAGAGAVGTTNRAPGANRVPDHTGDVADSSRSFVQDTQGAASDVVSFGSVESPGDAAYSGFVARPSVPSAPAAASSAYTAAAQTGPVEAAGWTGAAPSREKIDSVSARLGIEPSDAGKTTKENSAAPAEERADAFSAQVVADVWSAVAVPGKGSATPLDLQDVNSGRVTADEKAGVVANAAPNPSPADPADTAKSASMIGPRTSGEPFDSAPSPIAVTRSDATDANNPQPSGGSSKAIDDDFPLVAWKGIDLAEGDNTSGVKPSRNLLEPVLVPAVLALSNAVNHGSNLSSLDAGPNRQQVTARTNATPGVNASQAPDRRSEAAPASAAQPIAAVKAATEVSDSGAAREAFVAAAGAISKAAVADLPKHLSADAASLESHSSSAATETVRGGAADTAGVAAVVPHAATASPDIQSLFLQPSVAGNAISGLNLKQAASNAAGGSDAPKAALASNAESRQHAQQGSGDQGAREVSSPAQPSADASQGASAQQSPAPEAVAASGHAAEVAAHVPAGNGVAAQLSAPGAGATGAGIKTQESASPAPAANPQPLAAINAARIIQNAGQTEMRVGMRSAEFGNISITTLSSRESISAQISVDHGELAKTIAASLPEMQARMGGSQAVNVRVEMNGAATSSQGSGTSGQGFHGGTPNGSADHSRGGRSQAGTAAQEYTGQGALARQFAAAPVGVMTGESKGAARLDVRA